MSRPVGNEKYRPLFLVQFSCIGVHVRVFEDVEITS